MIPCVVTEATTQPNLTPWIGIIGAIIGAVIAGTIGFAIQRMNIREQRRKDMFIRIVDFARVADDANMACSSLIDAIRTNQPDRQVAAANKLETVVTDLEYGNTYLLFTVPFKVYLHVNSLHSAAISLLALTFKFDSNDDSETFQAEFNKARLRVTTSRIGLLSYLNPFGKPDPWWRRQTSKLRQAMKRPFNRRPKGQA